MIRTWETEITSGNLRTAPIPLPFPGQWAAASNNPLKQRPHLLCWFLVFSFLVQIPKSSPLEPSEFQSAENSPALFGRVLWTPWTRRGLGIPGQHPVAAHLLGETLALYMSPAEGNLGLLQVPRFQMPRFYKC